MFSIGNVVKFQNGSSSEWIVAGTHYKTEIIPVSFTPYPCEFLYLVSLNLDCRAIRVHSERVEFIAYNVADYIASLFNRKVKTS